MDLILENEELSKKSEPRVVPADDILFKGFSKLTFDERLAYLKSNGYLNSEDVKFMKTGGLKDVALGEKFIENTIGYFQLPIGVATNFIINGRNYVIPMAVEETSIIAAASKTARWVKDNGRIETKVIGSEIIGQIQIAKVKDFDRLQRFIEFEEASLVAKANTDVAAGMVVRGGGVRSLKLRKLVRPDGLLMAVIHVHMDAVDAMGANIMNQVCEYLKTPIQDSTEEMVTMCILSNLVDSKLTEARITIEKIDPELAEKIEEASLFAQLDPYRASTNNKGVMNGIDPILIATGNDWRAVEAGVHAYASLNGANGQYGSITKWYRDGNSLVGFLKAPIIVGTVGGVTNLHPMSQMSLKMLGFPNANLLSQIIASVGLVQNLGALKALTTVGIIEGHMRLHAKNLALGAGAEEAEIPYVQKKLEEILAIKKRITLSHAIEVLRELREQIQSKSN